MGDPKETMEQMQERIRQLEAELAKKRQPKTKGTELRIEFETGNVQIRRVLPQAINLPAWVLLWLFENQGTLKEFIEENKHLLTMIGDTEISHATKLQARKENLLSENPVVRKPRENPKTQES